MEANDVGRVLVVGGGVMGHSIAQVFAQAGIEVNLMDVSEKVLEQAIRLMESNLETLAEHGSVKDHDIQGILNRVHPFSEIAEASRDVAFVLEAVSENPEVKIKVFSDLEAYCPEDAVFASNTSGLDIFDIVKLNNNKRLVVAHWFAPAHVIPLVEIAPGPETSKEAVAFTKDLMERIGKKTIVMKKFVRQCIVSRIQRSIVGSVIEILINGWAKPEEVDLAIKASLGVRLPIVGVVQTLDFNGLDLVLNLMKKDGLDFSLIEDLVSEGHLGAKTAKGIYDYGGRSETEILRKRDKLCLELIEKLEEMNAFEPV